MKLNSSGSMQSSVPPNLPVGWRFRPTHLELLHHYLRSKILGLPIDYFHIEDIELDNFNPCDLPDSLDEERYFFCRPEIYLTNGRTKRKRKAGDGFWKCTGQTISVTPKDSNEKIGTRKILVYHDPSPTKWVIHEYEYTAKLNLPVKGDFVLWKLKNNAHRHSKEGKPYSNKNRVNNDSNKVESSSTKTKAKTQKTKPNKKARKDLSIAAVIENQNVPEIRANSPYGEGDQCNHMASNFKTQDPNYKTTFPPCKIGESSYQNLSDCEFQNSSHFEYDVSNPRFTSNIYDPQNSSHFEYNQDVSHPEFTPGISNSQKSCHFEHHQDVSGPQFTPNIYNPQNSSHFEYNQDVSHPEFTPGISNPQKSCHFEHHQDVSGPQFTPNIYNPQNSSHFEYQDVFSGGASLSGRGGQKEERGAEGAEPPHLLLRPAETIPLEYTSVGLQGGRQPHLVPPLDVSHPQFTPDISNPHKSCHFEYHQDVSGPQFTPNIYNPQNYSHFEYNQNVSHPEFTPGISNPQKSCHFEHHQDVSGPQFTPNIYNPQNSSHFEYQDVSHPQFTPDISNPQKSCHFEYHQDVSGPQFTPNISNPQKSSHFEYHQNVSDIPNISNFQFIPNISNSQSSQDVYNRPVINSPSESQLFINSVSENTPPMEMIYDSSSQENKDSNKNTYSLAPVECQFNKMHSNFENQNQYEKPIDSIHEYTWGALMTNDIQETTFQDLESQHEKTDMTVFEDCQNSFSEQQLPGLMACDQLDDNLSSPPEFIYAKQSLKYGGFATSMSAST